MNNDLISREALKAEIALMFGDKMHITESVCELIDNVPSVDISKEVWNKSNELLNKRLTYLARPQGEWIDHSEDGYIECPICEHLTTCEDNIDELHYCWHCGAKLGKGGAE